MNALRLVLACSVLVASCRRPPARVEPPSAAPSPALAPAPGPAPGSAPGPAADAVRPAEPDAVATASATSSVEDVAPEAVPPRADAAEECISDVPGDAVRRWPEAFEDRVARAETTVRPLADLDGDGSPESMVVAESRCGVTGNCPHLLYVSHRGCTHYAGAFWAEWDSERVLPEVRRGMHDIGGYLNGGCAGREGAVLRWGWDGTSYVQVRSIDCACPDDDAVARRDPLCPP